MAAGRGSGARLAVARTAVELAAGLAAAAALTCGLLMVGSCDALPGRERGAPAWLAFAFEAPISCLAEVVLAAGGWLMPAGRVPLLLLRWILAIAEGWNGSRPAGLHYSLGEPTVWVRRQVEGWAGS